jgi:hypothetical protein
MDAAVDFEERAIAAGRVQGHRCVMCAVCCKCLGQASPLMLETYGAPGWDSKTGGWKAEAWVLRRALRLVRNVCQCKFKTCAGAAGHVLACRTWLTACSTAVLSLSILSRVARSHCCLSPQTPITRASALTSAARFADHEVVLKICWHAGQELGYFSGCLSTTRAVAAQDPTVLSQRTLHLLREAEGLVQQYPRGDPTNSELQTAMDKIRSKFKKVLASLGILGDIYPRDDKPTTDF